MSAFSAIILLSLLGVLGLRFLLGTSRDLLGSHEVTALVLLPALATFGGSYLIFAAGVMLLMIFAPAVSRGGLMLTAPLAIERRTRLYFFCLVLMPTLPHTFSASGITIIQLNYVSLLSIGYVIAMIRAGAVRSRHELFGWDVMMVLMLGIQIIMDARGHDVPSAFRAMTMAVLNIGLIYFIASRAFARTKEPDRLVMMLLLAACIISLFAVVEAYKFWLLHDPMRTLVGADFDPISGYTKQRGGMLRARATFTESTSLSLFLGVMMSMLYGMRARIGSVWLVLAMALALSAGIFATFARVGYIAVVVGIAACFIYERRFGRLAVIVAISPAIGWGALTIAENVPAFAASLGLGADAVGSVDYRAQLWEEGTRIVREHPFFGLSLPELEWQLRNMRQGEGIIDLVNQPLAIVMRSGLLGAAIYSIAIVAVLVSLQLNQRRLDEAGAAVACGCFGGIVAMLAGLTTTSYGRNYATLVMFIGIGAGLIVRSAAQAGKRAPVIPEARPALSGESA